MNRDRESTLAVAGRIRLVRTELYGEHGGPVLAERVGVPARTWSNYEAGVTMPGVVLLRFLIATGIEPEWLLNGGGARYRTDFRRADMGQFMGAGEFRRNFGGN